jgi:capsular polysaccharide transport system permease protein
VILAESDRFINQISQKVAQEQLAQAEKQLADASQRLATSKEELLAYQNKNKVFDPAVNAESISQLIAGLKANLAELQTQERTLLSYLNPDTPQVVSVRSQIQAVEQQIAQEQAKLTSPNETKLNRQAVQFETLKSNVEFSVDLYKLALTSLETSRLEAVRKMKNVIVISSPQRAQEALYPRQWYLMLSTFLICCLLYAITRLSLSVIRDHQD